MPDADQFGIYSKEDLSLIKNTFGRNDTLLYTIRKVFLQFPLTEAEQGLIGLSVTPAVYVVLKKRMLPDPSPAFPLGQIASINVTLTEDMKVLGVEEMLPKFEAKQLEIEYLTQQFAKLQDLDADEPIRLWEMGVIKGKSPHQQFVDMTAYLYLLGYIDPMLNMVRVAAGEKDETPEQQIERLKRDSTQ